MARQNTIDQAKARAEALSERAKAKKAEFEKLNEKLQDKVAWLEKHGETFDSGLKVIGSIQLPSENGQSETSSVKAYVSDGNEIEVHEFTDPQNHIRVIADDYTEIGNEFNVFESHYNVGKPILLEGPKGCGKSLALAKWASDKKLPYITFDCSEGIKEGHLVGTLIVKEKNGVRTTPFHLGVLPTIIKVANAHGGAVLVMEELNALTTQMQKLLNGILDWRKSIYVEKIGKHVKVNKGVKLLVAATMNPSSYSGVNEINDDLLSRFTVRHWGYASMSDERRILKKLAKDIPKENVKGLLKLAQETRAAEKSGQVTHSISTRELADMLRIYPEYAKWCDNPLTEIINEDIRGMYDNDVEQWKLVKSRIESIFGSEVFNIALTKMTDEEIETEASE